MVQALSWVYDLTLSACTCIPGPAQFLRPYTLLPAEGLAPVDLLLLMAAQENDAPRVAELIRAGADLNTKVCLCFFKDPERPLHSEPMRTDTS